MSIDLVGTKTEILFHKQLVNRLQATLVIMGFKLAPSFDATPPVPDAGREAVIRCVQRCRRQAKRSPGKDFKDWFGGYAAHLIEKWEISESISEAKGVNQERGIVVSDKNPVTPHKHPTEKQTSHQGMEVTLEKRSKEDTVAVREGTLPTQEAKANNRDKPCVERKSSASNVNNSAKRKGQTRSLSPKTTEGGRENRDQSKRRASLNESGPKRFAKPLSRETIAEPGHSEPDNTYIKGSLQHSRSEITTKLHQLNITDNGGISTQHNKAESRDRKPE